MAKHKTLDKILALDPVKDHQQIVFLTSAYEFPWDMTRALEFALFRTYAVPETSALLAQTGEFVARAQKRYDDTDLLISELYNYGYDSDHGRAALRRMNQQHGRYTIANENFLYVLTTFVFEPARWMDKYGWRAMTRHEKLAQFYFWRELGRYMNIKNIPDTIEELEAFNVAFERDHFRYDPTNTIIGGATRDLLLSWYMPKSLIALGYPAVYALMDDPLREAFGFPNPPEALKKITAGALRARSAVVRLLPERKQPFLRTQMRHRSYPNGYKIEELGPKIES
ncbi:MAG TPA: oxygenase MpaB family protein [Phototrophicaceae bacterium]|nr:oxygenase MpaB family protein [Phototrophicaceae bacterium]